MAGQHGLIARKGVRLYDCGPRCPRHTPAAIIGEPEPDELLARHRAMQTDGADNSRTLLQPVDGFPHPPGQGGP